MGNLSKREKILLYFLGLIAIAAGMIALLIQPALLKLDDLELQLNDAELKRAMMESKLPTRPAIEAEIAKQLGAIAGVAPQFLPTMENDALDRDVTGLLQKSGLVSQSLTIAEPTAGSTNSLKKVTVQTACTGSLANFTSLAQLVQEKAGLRIKKFALQDRADTAAVTITFEALEYDKNAPLQEPEATTEKGGKAA